jgi:hypothetical protein
MITLVGEGFRSYPCLVICDLISADGPADPAHTAQLLGEDLESDRSEFQRRFYLKQLLVTGEVSEKSSHDDSDDLLVVTLRATPATRIVCEMDDAESMASESVRIGDSVTIIGWNTKENPTDALTLAQCLFWRGSSP